MTIVVYVLSVPLIAEFVFAPFNLWRGRTIENWSRFTGLSTRVAHVAAAPAKLATAALLIAGVFSRLFGLAGAAAAVAISLFYLARLAHPGRRAGDGIVAFTLFGAVGVGLFVAQTLR